MSVKILAENLIDPEILVQGIPSSENPSFPAVNVYNKKRRSKVWRTQGFWEITSLNNKLIFRETTTVDLTATIAVSNYASTVLLMAAIKAALEVAGASVYTITQDLISKKIKVTSDGLGGGGIFELINTDVLSTLASVIGFDISTDKTGALTYTADFLKIHTKEFLTLDLGISTNPQCFLLIGKRNAPIQFSSSATLKLQANATDAWTSPTFETTLTYNEKTILLINPTGLSPTPLRYWRLLIQDSANPNGFIEIGSLYLGNFYSTQRGAAQFPLKSSFVDRSTSVISEGGQIFSGVREKTQEFSLDWNGLTYSELEVFNDIFQKMGTSVPFFVILDPDGAFSSSQNFYSRYVKFSSDPNFLLESPNNFSFSMQLREEL
ncbi:MAG: hypothetical protein SGI74_12905 [Oligoflexia bacterium]|nr:hypothetical protein [Oligoflexia bacterium]